MAPRTNLPGIQLEFTSNVRDLTRWMMSVEKILGVGTIGFMHTIASPYLQHQAADRFRDEGGSGVPMWAPLTVATQEFRERAGFPREHPINVRTGEMERYIAHNPSPQVLAAPGNVVMRWPGTPATSELRKKITTAQKGRGKPKTPARPVITLTPLDGVTLTGLLSSWFMAECSRLRVANTVP